MFITSQANFDGITPPLSYFGSLQSQAQEQRKRQLLKLSLRSAGVMLTSFAIVFISLYTIFTWPLVYVRGSFFVEQIFKNGSASEVQATSTSVVPLNIEDPNLDSDKDGYTDQEELAAGFDPYNAEPVKLDSDGDGIKDEVERTFYGTDPYKSDSDSDG
ncbi:MAG: thrombospondin type 3 repeat-containing protein, partial [Parcubacteria group bacterium]